MSHEKTPRNLKDIFLRKRNKYEQVEHKGILQSETTETILYDPIMMDT